MSDAAEWLREHKVEAAIGGGVVLLLVVLWYKRKAAAGSTAAGSTGATTTGGQYLVPVGTDTVTGAYGADAGSAGYAGPGGATSPDLLGAITGLTTALNNLGTQPGAAGTGAGGATSTGGAGAVPSPAPAGAAAGSGAATGATAAPASGVATFLGNQQYGGFTYGIWRGGTSQTLEQLAHQLYPGAPVTTALSVLEHYDPRVGTNPNAVIAGDLVAIPNSPQAPVLPSEQPTH